MAINGADSFGNICNQAHNRHFENFSLSGTDTSRKPYLFYFDIENFNGVVKICVEYCPHSLIDYFTDMHHYQKEIPTQLCFYDINVAKEALAPIDKEIGPLMSRRGPCPLMISKR